MTSIRAGVLGATGMVGQRFVQLLADHPWFTLTALAASDRSAGQRYGDACSWQLRAPMPRRVADIIVSPITPDLDCDLVFSALPSQIAARVEEPFARAGYAVCTNAAPHRMGTDVPLLVPEVNPDHTRLLEPQRRRRGGEGSIVASANCSTTQLALALKPLHDAFGLRRLIVVSMQAVSGAGYPGVPSLDIVGNVVPLIRGEEEKVETEPLKILGALDGDRIEDAPFAVSAQCNRVPVRNGHMECVSVEFGQAVSTGEIVHALESFRGPPAVQALPSSPSQPIVVRTEADRPQPLRDTDAGSGMSVVVGRVRSCPVLDARFVVLGHNTIRGAAGGALHNAELLAAQGWL